MNGAGVPATTSAVDFPTSLRSQRAAPLQPSRPKHRRKKSARDLRIEARNEQTESRLYNVTLDVHSLRQQIHELTVRRCLLQARARSEGAKHVAAITSRVDAYFDIFKHGYTDSNGAQVDFMRAFASQSCTLGLTAHGVSMLLEQWHRYTAVFCIRNVELLSSEQVVTSTACLNDAGDNASVVVKCTAEFRGVFTRLAVDTVFPNARAHLWELLHVLGCELICPLAFHLYFDIDGLLVRQDLAVDFFTAINELLGGDAVCASAFLEGARVGEESMIDSPWH